MYVFVCQRKTKCARGNVEREKHSTTPASSMHAAYQKKDPFEKETWEKHVLRAASHAEPLASCTEESPA